ncbi:MAG: hypothetical protein AB1485_09435, partial [Candidatus Thermoplasmatota archaeon]
MREKNKGNGKVAKRTRAFSVAIVVAMVLSGFGVFVSTIGSMNVEATTNAEIQSAVDNTALTFTLGGNAYWYRVTDVYYYGGDSARSGKISHNQQSWVQTTVTGPGTLKFYWKVSSEASYDFL